MNVPAVSAVALGDVISVRGLVLAVPLAAFVLLLGWLLGRGKRRARRRPGQFLRYEAPGKNAAACRGLLGRPAEGDLFAYRLRGAAGGGWYIHFTRHNATAQPLGTLFLLQFEGDEPAVFSLQFVSEAFGVREPVIGEALLDAFFAQKLAAARLPQPDGDDGAPAA